MSEARLPLPVLPRLEFLIVTGEATSYKILAQAVGEIGAVENCTPSVAAAKVHIAGRKIEGVFLDVPVDSAFEIITEVRQSGLNHGVVIFACVDLGVEAGPLLRAGANFVLQKPLSQIGIGKVMNVAMQMMAAEMRGYVRYQLAVPVILKSKRMEQRAVTVNISRGGMTVQCREAYKPHTQVEFALQLPGRKLPALTEIAGPGEVVWATPDGRMGIRFDSLPEDIQTSLWHWLEQQTSGL